MLDLHWLTVALSESISVGYNFLLDFVMDAHLNVCLTPFNSRASGFRFFQGWIRHDFVNYWGLKQDSKKTSRFTSPPLPPPWAELLSSFAWIASVASQLISAPTSAYLQSILHSAVRVAYLKCALDPITSQFRVFQLVSHFRMQKMVLNCGLHDTSWPAICLSPHLLLSPQLVPSDPWDFLPFLNQATHF